VEGGGLRGIGALPEVQEVGGRDWEGLEDEYTVVGRLRGVAYTEADADAGRGGSEEA